MNFGIRHLGLNLAISPNWLHESVSFVTSAFFVCKVGIINNTLRYLCED